MRRTKKWLALVCTWILVFSLAFGNVSMAIVAVPLDNGQLRFGSGSEDSITSSYGTLKQPWYKNGSTWYKLTYSSYALDYALGVDGTSVSGWNIEGTVASNPAQSGMTVTPSSYSSGHGTLTSTGTVTVGGKSMRITNVYVLNENASFIKVTTTVQNLSGATVPNVRYWTGTRDDYVGGYDDTDKIKGNLVGGAFVANTSSSQQATALKISGGAHNVLFFSTDPSTEMSMNSYGAFTQVTNTNPRTTDYSLTSHDGAYGMFVHLGALDDNESASFDWYYAAGDAADIADIISDIDDDAGGSTPVGYLSDLDAYEASGSTTGAAITFTPAFDTDTTDYSATVPYETDSIALSATTTAGALSVTIDGESVASGGVSDPIELAVGVNEIDVVVTGSDSSTRTYTLSITRSERVSDIAFLTSLELFEATEATSGSAVTVTTGSSIRFSPDFDTSLTEYAATVPYSVRSVSIVATTTDSAITIAVDGVETASGEASRVVSLAVGENEIEVLVTSGDETDISSYTITVTRRARPTETTAPESDPVYVIVNGERQDAGDTDLSTENGRSVFSLTVDENVILDRIEQLAEEGGDGVNSIEVPITNASAEEIVASLNGRIIDALENNRFDLSITRNGIEYIVPAGEFAVDQVAAQFGIPAESLQNITYEVRISEPSAEEMAEYEQIASELGIPFVIPPIAFEITASAVGSDGQPREIRLDTFSTYVERVFPLPANIDPSQITTGIVFNEDGTWEHVPTSVFEENGLWYARISSLSNSVYSIIYHPVVVAGVEGHWAEAIINDMASRMVLVDTEGFQADAALTRGEFIEYVVRGLGLYREGIADETPFKDVALDSRWADAVYQAEAYGIISGYEDGAFRPGQLITREEAMAILARAMNVTELKNLNDVRVTTYVDYDEVTAWAAKSVRDVVGAGVFVGTSPKELDPGAALTSAQGLAAVRNLLVKSGLINE